MNTPIYAETVAALGDPAEHIHEIKLETDVMYRAQSVINNIFDALCAATGMTWLKGLM